MIIYLDLEPGQTANVHLDEGDTLVINNKPEDNISVKVKETPIRIARKPINKIKFIILD